MRSIILFQGLEQPGEICWRWRFETHHAVLARMFETESFGMQGLAPKSLDHGAEFGIDCGRQPRATAVERIAQQRIL